MPYLGCSQCRARFHTGAIYEPRDHCSRCGAPLNPPSPSLRERLRGLLRRQAQGEPPDWETITSSQYTRQAHTDNNDGGTTTG